MIARTWRGWAEAAATAGYVEHLREGVLPTLEGLDGFRGLLLLRGPGGVASSELTVVTLWESMDAIRGFAGDRPEEAVVEPAARALLSSYDDRVDHREVLLSALPTAR